jgi:hypothetical protein
LKGKAYYHKPVPEDFTFPSNITIKTLFELWNFGDENRLIRPYKLIDTHFIAQTKCEKKNLSRAKGVIRELEKYIDSNNYKSLTSQLRDGLFQNATEKMQENLQLTNLKRKQPVENFYLMKYSSLYENYLVKKQKKNEI